MAADDLVTFLAATLGARGRLDPARCSHDALAALVAAAGPAMALASFSLELGSAAFNQDERLDVRIATDKRTSAIVFLSLAALVGETTAFTARAVFSRED